MQYKHKAKETKDFSDIINELAEFYPLHIENINDNDLGKLFSYIVKEIEIRKNKNLEKLLDFKSWTTEKIKDYLLDLAKRSINSRGAEENMVYNKFFKFFNKTFKNSPEILELVDNLSYFCSYDARRDYDEEELDKLFEEDYDKLIKLFENLQTK